MAFTAWDWNMTVDSDGDEFVTFEEGDYLFKVVTMERGMFNGSAKLQPSPQLELGLEISNDAGQTSKVNDKIIFSLKFKLPEFLRAIGQKKHGQPCVPQWDKIIGSEGIAHVTKDEDKKKPGNFYNHISKYMDYDPEMVAKYKEAQGAGNYQQASLPTEGTGWGGGWN